MGEAEEHIVNICGYASRGRYMKEFYMKNFGYGEKFCMHENQMEDPEQLGPVGPWSFN
jgi:hypothetical protein